MWWNVEEFVHMFVQCFREESLAKKTPVIIFMTLLLYIKQTRSVVLVSGRK